ncbi:MAG TPA: SRPBCC domain-containing protein [Polyangiaceae bacterium]|nr:SRPBCC domain-containing protein [Polyangiaceae bacterium]
MSSDSPKRASDPSPTRPFDMARVSVLVHVDPDTAFRIFSEDIDQWWRRGYKYRASGADRGILYLEPRVGGRLYESFERAGVKRVVETGLVLEWSPPERLAFEWRSVTFAPHERTHVEVRFEPQGDATLVTVTHRGFAQLPPEHPVRHGAQGAAFIGRMALWWSELVTSYRERSEASASS